MSFYQKEPRIKIGTDTPPQFLRTTADIPVRKPVVRIRETKSKTDDAFAKYHEPEEPTF